MKGSFDLTVQPMQAWKTDAKTSMMMIIVLKRTIIYNFNLQDSTLILKWNFEVNSYFLIVFMVFF